MQLQVGILLVYPGWHQSSSFQAPHEHLHVFTGLVSSGNPFAVLDGMNDNQDGEDEEGAGCQKTTSGTDSQPLFVTYCCASRVTDSAQVICNVCCVFQQNRRV